MTTLVGRGISVFEALVLASAIELHTKGIKANRNFSIVRGMKMAEEITGQKFGRRDYVEAQSALRRWAKAEKVMAEATGDIS